MRIRRAAPADRERILEILHATGRFTLEEIGWAIELVDSAVRDPERGEYLVYLATRFDDDRAEGYVCFGPTPLTEGVWDLYWIAVDPRSQNQGIGQTLLRFVETEASRSACRMLLIETSSKESYVPTVRFYERNGYREISRIKDFYRVRDDKIVLARNL